MTEDLSDVSAGEQSSRERSTIRFPYNDLNDAIDLARALHDKRGDRCHTNELAAELGHSPTSGRWRIRLAGAQVYGLISLAKGQVTLTPLGSQIIDPPTERDARVRAFLNVPLYDQLYRDCKGPLPGPQGLEAKMRALGVAANQAARARQVFARAARQAGFFATSPDKLVKPHTGSIMEERDGGHDAEVPPARPDEGGGPLSDPILHGLLTRMLPAEGKPFPARDRRLFFTALAVNLNVIYGEPEDGTLDPAQVAALIKLNPSAETATTAKPAAPANGTGPMARIVPEVTERTTVET